MEWKKKIIVLPAVLICMVSSISLSVKAELPSDDKINIALDLSSKVDADGCLTSSDGAFKAKVQLITKELTADDFKKEHVGITSNNFDRYTAENAGKVVVTIQEGGDTNDMSFPITIQGPAYTDLLKVTGNSTNLYTSNGGIRPLTPSENINQYVKKKGFYIKNSTHWFGAGFTDQNGNYYLAKYPYKIEIPNNEYIVKTVSPSSVTGFVAVNGIGKNEVLFDGNNVITIKPETQNYNSSLAGNLTFTPRYAYGASGVGANEDGSFTTNGEQITEDGYHFKVKNGEGGIKEYVLKVDMPFEFEYQGFNNNRERIAKIYDNGIEKGVNLERTSTLKAGDTIKVSINLPEGQELSEVEVRLKDKEGEVVPVTINAAKDGFSFKMPRSKVKLTKMEFKEDTSPRFKITTAVSVKDSKENAVGCYVVALVNEKDTAESIKKGTEITLTAKNDGIGSDKRLHDYRFDHWENVDVLKLTEEQKKSDTIMFEMPESDLSVTAVYVHDGTKLKVGITHRNGGTIQLAAGGIGTGYNDITLTNDGEGGVAEDYYHPFTYQIVLKNYNPEAYALKGWLDKNGKLYDTTAELAGVTWSEEVDTKGNRYICPTVDLTVAKDMTFIASFEPKTAWNLTVEPNDSKMGSATASLGETAITAGTTLYDGQTITLKAVPKSAKYLFKEWKLTKPESGVTVAFTNQESAETTFVMPAVSGGQMTIQAVFMENPNYKSEECILSSVELLKSDGTLVKKAEKDEVDGVTTFIVQLTPKEMTKDEAGKLGTASTYKLRLTYSDKATAKIEGGYGDTEGDAKWYDGITNPISVGTTKTVTITAQNPDYHQDYNVKIVYDDKPFLTAGAVKRLSDTEATVDFTSSSAGYYYYAVVEKDATEPEINTNGSGVKVKANKAVTISLKSLTAGAKDIYIVVKDDEDPDNVKITDPPLKISIPAYDPEKTGYTIETPQSPGGTISADKKVAKEGELVTVTVTPDAGKKIKPDGLRYSQSGPPYAVVKIDTTTKQFKMPAYDITISCVFVDADTVTADGPTISAFIVNGVSGAINDTTGTITVTLPYGTDLTALKPAITLKGAVSVSPASGEKVDLSSPKTYTVTAEDGTTKTYTVTAYTEEQPKSDKLWESMLEQTGGSTDHTGKNTWWKKAKDMKKHNDYPKYW